MIELIKCFDWSKHEIVSVIGSGGKSSLIEYLARGFYGEKVLVSTTTKILMPKNDEYDILWLNPYSSTEKVVTKNNVNLECERFIDQLGEQVDKQTDEQVDKQQFKQLSKQQYNLKYENTIGILIAGDEIQEEGLSKLKSPTKVEFYESFDKFDKVFLESDGSRGLPLKGWEEYEPVILNETTMTIGVFPISAIGKPVTKEFIHRLPLWLGLIDGEDGLVSKEDSDGVDGLVSKEDSDEEDRVVTKEDTDEEDILVTKEDIVRVIAHENGLWKKAIGDRILFINQVEDEEKLSQAKEIVKMLPIESKSHLTKIIAGSVKEGKGTVLYNC
jgi:probable selenium-dependent hydroxylase accessory protein YqeC